MIEIYHLYKKYLKNELYALEDINLIIDRGEFVFVVGHSGSGKSTLLKLLLREILPTKGSIKIFGRDITRLKNREIPFLRRNIGMVFQDFRLLEDAMYLKMLPFLKSNRNFTREIRKRVPLTLELVGLKTKLLKGLMSFPVGTAKRCVARPSSIARPCF